MALACSQAESLASLRARFDAFGERFPRQVIGKKPVTLFTQPPKARFQQVTYAGPGVSRIYEFQGDGAAFECALAGLPRPPGRGHRYDATSGRS